MKPIIPPALSIVTVLATLALAAEAEILAPIVSLTGSSGGDQYANGMTSLTNGSGIDKSVDPDDPSTWVSSGTAYQDEWMGWYMKDGGVFTPGLNGKLAWAAFDLGESKPLIELWLFNNGYQGGISGVQQYNLYYADSPAVALPAQPPKNQYSSTGLTPQGDYDFSSGGWTLSNTSGPLSATKAGINSVGLRGVTARYLAVEILSNHGDTYKGGRVGLDEVAITVAPAVPTFGVIVPAGDVDLRWTNPLPNSGSDVWVDVWFGTDPAALTKVLATGRNTSSFTVTAPVADTYYWRLDFHLDGSPSGTPVTGAVWDFEVIDTDGDGLPDAFEQRYGGSPTTLNPGDDLEQGGTGDGLTNLQEYQFGTNPNNPDSDGDLLEDGPEVAGAGSRPPTDPTNDDTDGDDLNDRVESNTGTWASASDTGTNPTLPDTDNDGLSDTVETNTDSFVSETDTGTDPTKADSDSDGANDWYEIAASYTDPNVAADKPSIPYPRPDPDTSSGATDKPVKVYILSGQSNMVAFGRVGGGGPGTLQTLTATENKFPNLVDGGGAWTVRNDVMYRGVISAIGNGPLQPGFGANSSSFGPELGFGHAMGWFHDEPVLLIKSSIGNRSLSWDCLPPGSPRHNYNGNTYAGYGDSPNSWPIGGNPSPYVWYAGKQFDDYFMDEADMGLSGWMDATAYQASGNIGSQVRHNGVEYQCTLSHTSSLDSEPGVGANWTTSWKVYSVTNAADVLDNFAAQYPQFAAQGFEIAGYVWWQGYSDQGEPAASRYQQNMVQFIKQIRSYYENRYPAQTSPDTPFVLATLATGGWGLSGTGLKVANAQLAVDGDAGNYPEFAGNVKTMEARGYWRDFGPSDQGYHYNHNAETYLLTGDALGRGMVELLSVTTSAPGPQITSITPVGGGAWELTLQGDAATGYEFRSSATLNFAPGTLVENLTQGDPGSDPGTIGGPNNSVVTTDGSGNAKVRLALTVAPADFVRAQTAP